MIVDDHRVVRQGLAMLINAEPDLAVCGEATDAEEAMAVAAAVRPDVVLADLSLRDGDAGPLIRAMRTKFPATRVLVLSMHSETLHAERVLRAGAVGYVMKEEATAGVLAAIRAVLRGEVWISERVRSKLISRSIDPGGPPAAATDLPLDLLTDREFEVFALLGQGLTSAEMAQRLGVSVKTVDAFRERIKPKLGLRSGHALLLRAIEYALGEAHLPPATDLQVASKARHRPHSPHKPQSPPA
jgi:DNA-binding NarL/FixJ family response regulator